METTAQQDLGILLTEALREIREFRRENQTLKDMVEEIHCMFKPRTQEKRLTRKERFDLAVKEDVAREKARMIARLQKPS